MEEEEDVETSCCVAVFFLPRSSLSTYTDVLQVHAHSLERARTHVHTPVPREDKWFTYAQYALRHDWRK